MPEIGSLASASAFTSLPNRPSTNTPTGQMKKIRSVAMSALDGIRPIGY